MTTKPNDLSNSGEIIRAVPTEATSSGIIEYEKKEFSHCDISHGGQNNYRHAFLNYVSAKRGQFDNVDFSYSRMNDCYFHEAAFTNCKFIGAKLYRCNFRGARFDNCNFDYLDVDETRIPSDEMIKCLPDEPNKSREICQVLRRNANSLGDTRDSRRYVIKELDERKEHLRRAIRGQGQYYKSHYPGFMVKAKLAVELLLLKIDSFCWGHGEKIWKMWLPLLILIAVASVLQTFGWIHENPGATYDTITRSFFEAINYYVSFFLSVDVANIVPRLIWIEWLLASFRILALGMLVSSLFRWLSHR